MTKLNPKRHGELMNTLLQVWGSNNPTKSYSNLSLREVRLGFQPSLDARARIAALQAELALAIKERDKADDSSWAVYRRALSAIQADPQEGHEGPMSQAIKAVTRRSRRSGTHTEPAVPTQLAVTAEVTSIKPAA